MAMGMTAQQCEICFFYEDEREGFEPDGIDVELPRISKTMFESMISTWLNTNVFNSEETGVFIRPENSALVSLMWDVVWKDRKDDQVFERRMQIVRDIASKSGFTDNEVIEMERIMRVFRSNIIRRGKIQAQRRYENAKSKKR